MSLTRLLRLGVGLAVWGAAMLAVLRISVAQEAGGQSHSICGPWGCGPPTAALVGWHGFWLLLITPVVGLFIRFWPASRLRATGWILLASGIATFVGIAVWEAVHWLPSVAEHQRAFFPQRVLFSAVTLTDLPLMPVMVSGILMYVSARLKQGAATAKPCWNNGTSNGPGDSGGFEGVVSGS